MANFHDGDCPTKSNTILKTYKGTSGTKYLQMAYEYHEICGQFNVRIAPDKKSLADCVYAGLQASLPRVNNICCTLLILI